MRRLHAALRDVVIERTGPTPTGCRSSGRGTSASGACRPAQFEALHQAAVLEHRIFRTMPAMPGAAEALWRLSDAGVWIRIITHRLYVNWGHATAVADTVDWLDATGIPYRDLCFLGAKPQVEADCYVEDAPHNVEALRSNGAHVIVYDQPYNRSSRARAHDWTGVEDLVGARDRARPVVAGAAAGVRGRRQPPAPGATRLREAASTVVRHRRRHGGRAGEQRAPGDRGALLDVARRPEWAWAPAGRRRVVWLAAILFGALTVLSGWWCRASTWCGSGPTWRRPRLATSTRGPPAAGGTGRRAAARSGGAGGGRWRAAGPRRPVGPAPRDQGPDGQVAEGDERRMGVVAARVLAHHQQRVAQLQVVDHRGPRAHVRVADLGPPHHAHLPAGAWPGWRARPPRSRRSSARRTGRRRRGTSLGQHERAVRVAGRLPALDDGGGRRDGAEVAVEDRGETVADVGRRQPGPGLGGGDLDQALEAARQRVGVVRAHGQPRRRVAGEQPAEADVGARAEPGVGPRLDQRHPGRQAGGTRPAPRAPSRCRPPRCGAPGSGRGSGRPSQHGDRLVAVHDDEVDGGRPTARSWRAGPGGRQPGRRRAGSAPAWTGARGAALGSPSVTVPATDLDAARRLLGFCDASPSPYHACHRGGAAGRGRVHAPGRRGPASRAAGTSCAAARSSRATAAGHEPHEGFRIVGAHTDSPNLRIKPQPDVVRGGASWGSRPTGACCSPAGSTATWACRAAAVRRNGTGAMVRLLRVDRPVCAIPQLAIHLDRDVSTAGLVVDAQHHLTPLWGIAPPKAAASSAATGTGGLAGFVAHELGVDAADVLGWDLMLHDLAPGALVGRDDELIGSARSTTWPRAGPRSRP